MKSLSKLLIPALCLTVFTGCGSSSGDSEAEPTVSSPNLLDSSERDIEVNVSKENIDAQSAANQQIALDLLQNLSEVNPETNLVLSPYSISTAMAMAYEGMAGNTKAEMEETFHYTLSGEGVHGALNDIDLILNDFPPPAEGSTFELNTANALWLSEKHSFSNHYLDTVGQYYDARASLVDFEANQSAADMINAWIEGETNNLIQDLIDPSSLNTDTIAVLTNAVYFKGDWLIRFPQENSDNNDFILADGSSIQTETMALESKGFRYYVDDTIQAVELPYVVDRFVMQLIMPRDGSDAFISSLSLDDLNQLDSDLQGDFIDLQVPKFDFESSFAVDSTLKALGMSDAFDPDRADFSNLTDARAVISSIVHQATITVDEKGTEAAAATAVFAELVSEPPEPAANLLFDHPFLFTIKDKETGTFLFIGWVANPSKSL